MDRDSAWKPGRRTGEERKQKEMAYDVKCTVCGTVNRGLNLEETEGRMICERCGSETQDVRFRRFGKQPARTVDIVVRTPGNRERQRAE